MERISAGKIFRDSLKLWVSRPSVLLPLFVFFLLESALLSLLYLAPRPPISQFLGPFIRSRYGEAYLHYPLDLVLLPRLFDFSQTALLLVLGSFLIGWTASRVYKAQPEELDARGKGGIFRWAVQYVHFFCVTFLGYGILRLSVWAVVFFRRDLDLFAKSIKPSAAFSLEIFLLFCLVLGGAVLAELALLYAIPSVVVEGRNVFSAILRSFEIFRKHFIATGLLALLPVLSCFFLAFLIDDLPRLSSETFPEITLVLLSASVVLTFAASSALISTGTLLLVAFRSTESASAQEVAS